VIGTYAFANEVTLFPTPPGVPGVSIDIVSIDSQGVISGRSINSIGGMPIQAATDLGTIQVNDDCTAVVTWQAPSPGRGAIVILGGGKEMRSIGLPTAPFTWRGTWKRISRFPNGECSPGSLRGVYAVAQQGSLMMTLPGAPQPTLVPAVGLGRLSIDRQGKVTGKGTFSLPGSPVDYEVVDGQIDLQPDCVAKDRVSIKTAAQAGEVKGQFVVLDWGNLLWGIQTANSMGKPIITEIWTRIAYVPD
jgi:hypothetical protein